ncbi:MAG: D-glycero-beta-D-manno-heptose-7-phosphate kinase [Bacteroidales bacterium]|jgi:D-beta-D-heptose 7-phosphate kinase/D-beta-D-heptose 1-phosphate adenosyltransferase|nr:D-glycero-beta-D-manno-heptose-7-phosphate kinase [Bacteroidales bacterium]
MELNFEKASILVVGDLILDKYFHGSVSRISPEAPVPVVLKQYEKTVPGGAANVANNLAKLKANVSLLGIAGNDNNGWLLSSILKEENIPAEIITGDNPTVTKIRIIGEHQQICRLDVEKDQPHGEITRKELLEALKNKIKDTDLVLISDYDKGLADKQTTTFIIRQAKKHKVPVIIDPKKKDWSLYTGAFLVTPNLKEFREVCNRHQLDDKDLPGSGKAIREKFELDNLLITLSDKGMMLITAEEEFHVPTVKKEVFDVSGAGDTVIATLAACIANGFELKRSVEIANIAAGIVVGKFGTAPVLLEELQEAVFEF